MSQGAGNLSFPTIYKDRFGAADHPAEIVFAVRPCSADS